MGKEVVIREFSPKILMDAMSRNCKKRVKIVYDKEWIFFYNTTELIQHSWWSYLRGLVQLAILSFKVKRNG
jgi:hypothetical protein